MSNDTLSISRISLLIDSQDPFPISLDDAWKWLGYSRKDKALNTLKSNFTEGVDFSPLRGKSPNGGRPSDFILISIDCFKCLGMIAGTEKGREVRQYFLECEHQLKTTQTVHPVAHDQIPSRYEYSRLSATVESFKSITPHEILDFVDRAHKMLETLSPEGVDEADRSMLACIVREAIAAVYFTGSVLTDRSVFSDQMELIARRYVDTSPSK